MKEFGKTYTDVSVQEVVDSEAEFKQAFLDHKALMFRGMPDIDSESFSTLMETIYTKGNDTVPGTPVVFDQDHKSMFTQQWLEHAQHDPLNPSSFETGWHMDDTCSFSPPSMLGMYMHTFQIPKGRGNTLLMDMERLYELFDDKSKQYLQSIELDHRYAYFQHDRNNPDAPVRKWIHPAVRHHPVTGNPCFYWAGQACCPKGSHEVKDDEEFVPSPLSVIYAKHPQWEHLVKTCVYKLIGMKDFTVTENPEHKDDTWAQTQGTKSDDWAGITNPEMIFTQEWEENDVMIWDNRNIAHTFFGGWELGKRVFAKGEYAREPV